MNNTKGMSQVLSLIVAASVLMMVALTVIFLASGSLGDFGNTISSDSCTQTIANQCQARGTSTIEIPGSCLETGPDGDTEFTGSLPRSTDLVDDSGNSLDSETRNNIDASQHFVSCGSDAVSDGDT